MGKQSSNPKAQKRSKRELFYKKIGIKTQARSPAGNGTFLRKHVLDRETRFH